MNHATAIEPDSLSPAAAVGSTRTGEASSFVIDLGNGLSRLNLMVDNVRCAGCIGRIERALTGIDGVTHARVNLSTRRLAVEWLSDRVRETELMSVVEALGFPVALFDPETFSEKDARSERALLTALAVAGFAAANVMLLSVSVWAGHDGSMDWATRGMFHWISALIALPAVVYAGRPFFHSAAKALSRRQLNMDVPISLAVILATAMSLYQTIAGGEHAYFDAALGLLFFLLIGRYLDQRARSRARSAAQHLVRLTSTSASIVMPDGSVDRVPANRLRPGMIMAVAAGERFAADGAIVSGKTSIDGALLTGESMPEKGVAGTRVYAGTINLTAPVEVEIAATGDETLLAEIVGLMESAEQNKARYVRIADRVARIYAPAVHILAAVTFLAWFFGGAGWEAALMTSVAVLIITCPCALGLAVPTVQVVASSLLMRRGILLKSADGLERLADIDTVVFDKTGTLTEGRPILINADDIAADDLMFARTLSARSSHPLCRALVEWGGERTGSLPVSEVRELPGKGIEGIVGGETVNLGSAAWLGVDAADDVAAAGLSEIWMVRDNRPSTVFRFKDVLRPDAATAIETLRRNGIDVRMLSGDRPAVVAEIAAALGLEPAHAEAGCLPAAKVERLQALAASGRKVLMVGDGLNDAPALAEGYASMSPASAADISRTAADIVFQGGSLMAVPDTIALARRARVTVRQNFALAFAYNVIAVPLAMVGFATPLFAAVAMSGSSLVVTLNSLRLNLRTQFGLRRGGAS